MKKKLAYYLYRSLTVTDAWRGKSILDAYSQVSTAPSIGNSWPEIEVYKLLAFVYKAGMLHERKAKQE